MEHEAWYRPPASLCGRALFAALLPLKAPIHLTIPDVLMPRWADYYALTLVLATAWLSILAFLMNLALERIGCALGVSETVMGLTLGAVSTDAYRLGNDVPTAPTVSPITVDEMPVAQPKRSRQTVITYAHAESQSAESSNASM